MSIDTTVDFRRKLLRFTRPHYLDYARHTISRYYSNFGPRFRTHFKYLDCPDKTPEIFPPKFAIDKIWEPECGDCIQHLSLLNGGFHSYVVFWLMIVILITITLMLKKN